MEFSKVGNLSRPRESIFSLFRSPQLNSRKNSKSAQPGYQGTGRVRCRFLILSLFFFSVVLLCVRCLSSKILNSPPPSPFWITLGFFPVNPHFPIPGAKRNSPNPNSHLGPFPFCRASLPRFTFPYLRFSRFILFSGRVRCRFLIL